jgi:hypothetical protein
MAATSFLVLPVEVKTSRPSQGQGARFEGSYPREDEVMEITLTSSDLYDAAVAALAKLEDEADRRKALSDAAKLSMMQSEHTLHISADALSEWLARATAGKSVIYAYSGWFAHDAKKENPELMLLANRIHELAQSGDILLTQTASAPPSGKARPFEYRATLASVRQSPAWREDWLS